MLTLKNWRLARCEDEVRAFGTVSGHPKLSEGMEIHTSPIRRAEAEGDTLLLLTGSGNQYTLFSRDIAPHRQEETRTALEFLGADPQFAGRCLQDRERAAGLELEEADRLLSPGRLLLDVLGTNALQAWFKTAEGRLVPLTPDVHVGMFQDSVLVTDWEGGTVDFRYFPIGNRLEPYHVSDGLEAVLVRNRGCADVRFGAQDHSLPCPADRITEAPMASYGGTEGLFSPDAVNGKGLYSALRDSPV